MTIGVVDKSCGIVVVNNFSRHTHHCGTIGDIMSYHRPGTYRYIVPDFHIAHYACVRTHINIIAYNGTFLIIRPNINKLADVDIVSYFSICTYHNTYTMAQIETRPNFHCPVNVNT